LRERPKTSRAGDNRVFKPSFNGSKVVNSEFEHFKDFDEKVYTKRAGPGQVLLNPPNFLTNPLKKGLARC